jgi:diacylglycerol kinase family enzyme
VLAILKRNGHNVTASPTTGPATAGGIARDRIRAGADLVVVAGGDGAINEAAQGMVHSDVPLAILPGGTANVLAMEMKLGSRLERAAERLEECRPVRISLGRVTFGDGNGSRHFLAMAGVGLDAHIVRHVSLPLKARVGKLAYWLAGWSVFGRSLPQISVESGGRRSQCSFALLSKVRNYGGDFEIAREVSLLDDRFEMVLFEGRSSVPYAKYLAGLTLRRLNGMRGVSTSRTGSAALACPAGARVFVQVDGELAGRLPAEIDIVPAALTLLVPPEYCC